MFIGKRADYSSRFRWPFHHRYARSIGSKVCSQTSIRLIICKVVRGLAQPLINRLWFQACGSGEGARNSWRHLSGTPQKGTRQCDAPPRSIPRRKELIGSEYMGYCEVHHIQILTSYLTLASRTVLYRYALCHGMDLDTFHSTRRGSSTCQYG